MKIRHSCRDVTRLVLLGQERALRPGERLAVRLHLLVCVGCRRFVAQMRLLGEAMRRWRADEAPPARDQDPGSP